MCRAWGHARTPQLSVLCFHTESMFVLLSFIVWQQNAGEITRVGRGGGVQSPQWSGLISFFNWVLFRANPSSAVAVRVTQNWNFTWKSCTAEPMTSSFDSWNFCWMCFLRLRIPLKPIQASIQDLKRLISRAETSFMCHRAEGPIRDILRYAISSPPVSALCDYP